MQIFLNKKKFSVCVCEWERNIENMNETKRNKTDKNVMKRKNDWWGSSLIVIYREWERILSFGSSGKLAKQKIKLKNGYRQGRKNNRNNNKWNDFKMK